MELGIRNVVNDLLRTVAQVPLSPDGSRHWTVVVSAREENLQELHTWLDWKMVGQPESLWIPELTSEELTLIAEYCPRLTPLFSLHQLEPIVKNPFMLSLLEDQRMLLEPSALPPVATEIEVSEVWWERLVGSGGPRGRARQQALLELGKRAMRSPGRRLGGEGIAADVLTSFESEPRFARRLGMLPRAQSASGGVDRAPPRPRTTLWVVPSCAVTWSLLVRKG